MEPSRDPTPLTCSTVRNQTDKLIPEIESVRAAKTDRLLVSNRHASSKGKRVSYHVVFTFPDGYKCDICVVPCDAVQFVLTVSSGGLKHSFVFAFGFVCSAAEKTDFKAVKAYVRFFFFFQLGAIAVNL